MAINALVVKTIYGTGSLSSATIGAVTVKTCETKFTMAKTVVINLVGNSLLTEIYPILNDMDPPILLKHISIGMNHLLSLFLNMIYKIPAMKLIEYEIHKPRETD